MPGSCHDSFPPVHHVKDDMYIRADRLFAGQDGNKLSARTLKILSKLRRYFGKPALKRGKRKRSTAKLLLQHNQANDWEHCYCVCAEDEYILAWRVIISRAGDSARRRLGVND